MSASASSTCTSWSRQCIGEFAGGQWSRGERKNSFLSATVPAWRVRAGRIPAHGLLPRAAAVIGVRCRYPWRSGPAGGQRGDAVTHLRSTAVFVGHGEGVCQRHCVGICLCVGQHLFGTGSISICLDVGHCLRVNRCDNLYRPAVESLAARLQGLPLQEAGRPHQFGRRRWRPRAFRPRRRLAFPRQRKRSRTFPCRQAPQRLRAGSPWAGAFGARRAEPPEGGGIRRCPRPCASPAASPGPLQWWC
jgi:hypothetical protein